MPEIIQKTASGFRAEIAPMRRARAIVFSLVLLVFVMGWLSYWLRGPGGHVAAAFGIGVAAFISVGALRALLRELFGNEVIELDGMVLIVCDRVFGLKRTRTFDVTLMEDLRVGSSSYWQGSTYVMSDGRIQFDYEGRMISIGGNAAEDEAFAITDGIRAQMARDRVYS